MLFISDNRSRGQAILGPRRFVGALAKRGCRKSPKQISLAYEPPMNIEQQAFRSEVLEL